MNVKKRPETALASAKVWKNSSVCIRGRFVAILSWSKKGSAPWRKAWNAVNQELGLLEQWLFAFAENQREASPPCKNGVLHGGGVFLLTGTQIEVQRQHKRSSRQYITGGEPVAGVKWTELIVRKGQKSFFKNILQKRRQKGQKMKKMQV